MKTKEKIDLYKLHKDDYATPKKPILLKIKEATYLAISGQGEPDGKVFTEKIGALYGAAFTIKMTRKFAGQRDYAVSNLEGQWWADGQDDFSRVPTEKWRWKLLIRTPDFVKADELDKAIETLLNRGKSPSVREVRLESFTEGLCVQMLHVGPYEREHETITVMKAHAKTNDLPETLKARWIMKLVTTPSSLKIRAATALKCAAAAECPRNQSPRFRAMNVLTRPLNSS